MQAWRCPEIPAIEGPTPVLRLHDSSTREIRPTKGTGTARMYVCGITPYDATHIGHAATYLSFDLVHRYWRAAGLEVNYVQNVTDVDDPLLERAERDGVDWRDLAAREIELFRSDMTALRVLPPTDYVGAVESIDEISVAIESLLDAGHAYRVDDEAFPDVYFDHTASGQFGYESRLSDAGDDRAVRRAGRRSRASRQAASAGPTVVADGACRASRPGTRRSAAGARAGTSSAR